MTMNTEQNVFSISGAKIAAVTSNTSAAYTKGTSIEVPELTTMDVTVKSETKEAKYGAGKVADSFTIVTGYDIKFESVNIPLDVIALINGSTVTTSGAEGAEINTLIDKDSNIPALFNLTFKTDYVNGDPADFHMELPCVKGQIDVITKADDYWTCSFTGIAAAKKTDGEFRLMSSHKVKTAIV